MSDEDWENFLRELGDAEPCPPEDCGECGIPEDLCRWLRECAETEIEP